MEFKKLNDTPIQIEEVYNDGADVWEPCFKFNETEYELDDFIRVHDNVWFSGDDYPNYIHGVYSNGYFPIFIELIENDYVNVYEAVNG